MNPLARRGGLSDEYQDMRGDVDLGLATVREATATAQADLAARLRAVEAGSDPLCPEAYVVWARGQDATYQRHHTILPGSAPQDLASRLTPASSSSAPVVLTSDGFVNLGQACEYRLRYADITTTDMVDGIDVLLSNGTVQHFGQDGPGFDQVVEYLQEQGYTISTQQGSS